MQPKGIRIYNEIIKPAQTHQGDLNKIRKGRNSDLIKQRDTTLIYRYWYYVRLKRMRYDIVLTQLKTEFNLAERRISDIVVNQADMIRDINEKQPDISEIKKMFPYLNWNI